MRRYALLLPLATMFLGSAARADDADSKKPIRVLFVLGSPPYHDIVNLPPILERALDRAGGFEVRRLEPPAGKPADGEHIHKLADLSRKDTDVVLFYTTRLTLAPAEEAALKRFVEDGGGIVGLHGAIFSFENSDVWKDLMGGSFAGHLPGTFPLTVEITDRDHPIAKGIESIEVVDEEYTHKYVEGAKRHVVGVFARRPEGSKGKDNDIIWTREPGKGRVVFIGIGHDANAWNNPGFQKLVAQSLAWAAGRPREVTIPK